MVLVIDVEAPVPTGIGFGRCIMKLRELWGVWQVDL
jgi:hypothetical protein